MTTKFKTTCPDCGRGLRILEEKLQSRIRCPACRCAFVPAEQESVVPVEQQPTATPMETLSAGDTADDEQLCDSADIETLGRFRIKRKLGEGGFGAVYEAHDPQLDRTVAVKVPTFEPGNRRKRRRFETEAKSAAKLHHPNIVTVFENGQTDDGKLYIASEFVAGETLKDVLKDAKTLLRQKVIWVRDLALALHYAHSENVIHRDIKPENILIDGVTQRAKIADFGLAKVADESGDPADAALKTQDGILGTPAFMSPEQARGKIDEVGPLSDQYSLGAVLYQCLTGQPPFFGSTYVVVAAVAGDKEPPPVLDVSPSMPRDLAAICEKAMSKANDVRYLSCEDFATDLTFWLNGESVQARPLSTVQRALKHIRRNPVPSALAATSALLLIAVAALALSSRAQAIRDRDAIDIQRQAAVDAEAKANDLNSELQQTVSALADETERANRIATEATAAKNRAEGLLAQLQEEKRVSGQLTKDLETSMADKATAETRAAQAAATEKAALYIKLLSDAQSLIDQGQLKEARTKLEQTDAADRHFEYHYLRGLASPILQSYNVGALGFGGVATFAVSTGGRYAAFLLANGTLLIRDDTQVVAQCNLIHPGLQPIDAADCRLVFVDDWLVVSAISKLGEIGTTVISASESPLTPSVIPTRNSQKNGNPQKHAMYTSDLQNRWPYIYRSGEDEETVVVARLFEYFGPTRWLDSKTRLALNGRYAELLYHGTKTSKNRFRCDSEATFATGLAVSPKQFLVGTESGEISILQRDMQDRNKVLTVDGDGKPIVAACFGPPADQATFAFASESRLAVGTQQSPSPVFEYRDHGMEIARLQFMSSLGQREDPDTLLVLSSDQQIHQVSVNRKHTVREEPLANQPQTKRQPSPDVLWHNQNSEGTLILKQIVLNQNEHDIILNVDRARPLDPTVTLVGHTGRITVASMSADFSRVVSASLDGTVRIWDASSGMELLRIPWRVHSGALSITISHTEIAVNTQQKSYHWGDFRDQEAVPALRSKQ